MRKTYSFLVILGLAALLVACGITETTSVQSVTPTSPAAEVSQPDPTSPEPSVKKPVGQDNPTPVEKPMAEEPTPTVEVMPSETPSETGPTETPAEEMASAKMTTPEMTADKEEMAPAEVEEMHPQPTEAQLQLLARLPVLGSPAELNNEVWLNSEPLKLADLHGKVVIVEFWTYG